MNQTALSRSHSRNLGFERRLAQALEGDVRFDAFTRGRYATDASIYQILPQGVAFPKSEADIAAALTIAAEHGVPVIARGGGTSQNGQPIGDGLVLDLSRHFNGIRDYAPQARTVSVAPGLVLEALNTRLRKEGLFFPVEPSTASRCTIGGMAGNNSSGARSLRYGKMVDNVVALKAMFHDGEPFALGEGVVSDNASPRARDLMTGMLALAGRHREAIEAIVRLCASLSAAAERLLGEAAKIEVPAGAKPDSIPDYPEDRAERRLTPWQLGAEWLGKGGENRRFFREGDAFTELLRSHPFYDRMRADLHQLARDGKLQVGDSSATESSVLYSDINNVYSLGGVEGVGKYVIDYSTLLTGGLTGNLAVTYLGSHVAEVTVIGVNPDGSYEVNITVLNKSSLESATRIPKIGYEDWYKDSVGSFWNDVANNTNDAATTEKAIIWTETIYP